MARDFFIDFTKRSFPELLDLADQYLRDICPEWTSRDDNEINWSTIKGICYLLSISNFYIDLGVNEQDPYSVQIYQNALRNAKKIGYIPKKYVGASCKLDITITAPTSTKTISRGTIYSYKTLNYIQWDDAVFAIGETTKKVSVFYGTFSSLNLGASNGEAFQKFIIDDTTVQDKMVKVFINEGIAEEEWEIKDNLIMSYEEDKHCRMILNEDEKYELHFGDNKSGKIPVNGSTIRVEVLLMPIDYKTANYGNLPKGNIIKSDNADITTILQDEDATGGGDKESIEDISRSLPQWISVANRVVAAEDAVFLAKRVAGVKNAKCFIDGMTYNIYIIPIGGGIASSALQDKVLSYLLPRALPQISINILVPERVNINITVNLAVSYNRSRAEIRSRCIDALNTFLDKPEDVGRMVKLMDAYSILDDDVVKGVDNVIITELYRQDGTPGLGNVALNIDEVSYIGVVNVVATGGII